VWANKALLWLFPDTIANLFLLMLSVVVTRALHVDGLADSIDGLMGGRDRESRLAIMKDSRIGTAGVLAIVLVFAVKYLCLNNLFGQYKTVALLTAPAFARWSQMLMMFNAHYARENGMGKAFVGHVRYAGVIAASVITLGLSAFVIIYDERTTVLAVGIPVSVAVFTALWRWYVVRKIGGITGDSVGAASELNETLAFLLFVFLLVER
jgi:adenosylcobinamide-GDP ribazoletransferase